MLRAKLLGKLLSAQAQIEAQLLELQRSAGGEGVAAECSTQLSALVALQASVSTAAPGALAALRAEVSASVAVAASTAQQARAAVVAGGAMSAELAATSAATRSEVQATSKDLFERRSFDKYLTFASPEEEAAYRAREAENRRYITDQLARKTPEGDLNAAGATAGHMLEMETHGAASSKEFIAKRDRMIETVQKQREALRREGRSTDEHDRRLADDVRRFLKAKGVPEAEIEARMSASADPLEAVKPYLKTEQDARALNNNLSVAGKKPATIETVVALGTEPVITQQAALPPGLDDVMAKLRASGVATAEHQPNEPASHGVTAQERPVSPKSRTPAG